MRGTSDMAQTGTNPELKRESLNGRLGFVRSVYHSRTRSAETLYLNGTSAIHMLASLKLAVTAIFISLTLAPRPGFAQMVSDRYALFLSDPPVSSRFASRESTRSNEAATYRQQIETRQRTLRDALTQRNIQVTGSTSTVMNAVFVSTTPDRVNELKALPGVIGVVRMRRGKRTMNDATKLMNAPAAWNVLGDRK